MAERGVGLIDRQIDVLTIYCVARIISQCTFANLRVFSIDIRSHTLVVERVIGANLDLSQI